MGSLYRFSCPECGYETEVSGGLSRGMLAITHTVICPRCRELSDMTLAEEPWEFLSWVEREVLDEYDLGAEIGPPGYRPSAAISIAGTRRACGVTPVPVHAAASRWRRAR